MKHLIETVRHAAWQRKARRAEADRRAAKLGTPAWFTADERLRQLLGAPSATTTRRALHETLTRKLDAHFRQYGA